MKILRTALLSSPLFISSRVFTLQAAGRTQRSTVIGSSSSAFSISEMESESQTSAKEMGEVDNEQVTGHRKLYKQQSSAAHEKELDNMFPDTATGKHAWSPNSGVLPPFMLHKDSQEDESDESSFFEATSNVVKRTSSRKMQQHQKTLSRKMIWGQITLRKMKKKEKDRFTKKLIFSLGKIADFYERRIIAAREVEQRYSIGKCLQILGEIPGLVIGGPLYQFALRFLEKRVCREILIELPSHEARLLYLKYEQSLLER